MICEFQMFLNFMIYQELYNSIFINNKYFFSNYFSLNVRFNDEIKLCHVPLKFDKRNAIDSPPIPSYAAWICVYNHSNL